MWTLDGKSDEIGVTTLHDSPPPPEVFECTAVLVNIPMSPVVVKPVHTALPGKPKLSILGITLVLRSHSTGKCLGGLP